MSGWIKLHRKILDNPIAGRANYLALWVVLLLKANHKKTGMIWNNEVLEIKEGQFITGRKKLSKECGIPETTIEDILRFLESSRKIRQQKTTKYRLITILNWEKYQNSDSKATTKRQQSDTNKNDNNDKNEKKYIRGEVIHKQLGEKEDIIKDMYNYEPVDDNGNPIKRKIKRIKKDENDMLISVGYMWQEMCAKALKIKPEEVVMKKLYHPIRACYDREKFSKEDYKELFKYFFADKLSDEMKTSFDLCMSEKYVAKYKIYKRNKKEQKSLAFYNEL
jgi:hypothetical protein